MKNLEFKKYEASVATWFKKNIRFPST